MLTMLCCQSHAGAEGDDHGQLPDILADDTEGAVHGNQYTHVNDEFLT